MVGNPSGNLFRKAKKRLRVLEITVSSTLSHFLMAAGEGFELKILYKTKVNLVQLNLE